MKKRKEKIKNGNYRRAVISFLVALAVIALGFVGVSLKCYYDNHTPFYYEIDGRTLGVHEQISISMRPTQSWVSLEREDGFVSGAQYDGVIMNNLNKDFHNWELTIYLPQDGIIDSSWNGIYTEVDNTITITPMDYNNLIVSGDEQSFGFIFYSKMKVDFTKFSMTGYYQVIPQQYVLFWVLILFSVCWVVALIVYISICFKIRKLEKQRQKDREIISQAMMAIAHLVDAKDEYTRDHSLRVALYAAEIARRSGMKEEEITNLKYIALVHDCGKVGVPDSILKKKGTLTPEERDIVKSHTVLGGHILDSFTSIEGIRDGALYHHERFDGTGYPNKLKGKKIPVYARIIGVADAYDAMSSDRCYRPRLPREVVLEELQKNNGSQFDPDYVRHMIDMMEDGTADTIQLLKVEEPDITIL